MSKSKNSFWDNWGISITLVDTPEEEKAVSKKSVENIIDEPVKTKKTQNTEEESSSQKSVWTEWQFYLMLVTYFVLHLSIRLGLSGSISQPGILHFTLVVLIYQSIWLNDKEVTETKVGKTLFFLLLGNIAIFALNIILSFILSLL
jgi:hypothetical protein